MRRRPLNRINLLPLVFLPGVALIGYWLGGSRALMTGVAVWVGLVCLGSIVTLVRQFLLQLKSASSSGTSGPIAKPPPPA